jgi:hypothetical protein
MSDRHTLIRTMHDLGLAAWFGGSLMGAVGVNGATNDITDPRDRARIAADGWARWAPVNAAAIGAHLVGGAGLLLANRKRVAAQQGVGANTVAKTVLTGAAVAATAYSGLLGAKVAKAGQVPAESGTKPSVLTPDDVASAQQKLRVLQWSIPVLTGTLEVLAAQQGEQQRGDQVLNGVAAKVGRKLSLVA